VIDLDIAKFFDTVPHDLVLKAVAHHISDEQRWILLYIKRWLEAPMQQADGTLVARGCGTPQGSAISPLLANLFMHYAFDMWMVREFPGIQFERYCDDVVVHCDSQARAQQVRVAIEDRLAQVGLRVHPDKTKLVYCKDADRRQKYPLTSFVFLGYEFRPRLAKNRYGKCFVSFLPAVSNQAMKAMSQRVRSWHWTRRSDKSLDDLARMFNPVVQGWINYYGRFYRSWLVRFLRRLNRHLVGWATRKYKRLKRKERRAMAWLAQIARRSPGLFAHWRFGARPDGWAMGAG
jgi:RNA-directed DNA polymerase